MNHAKVRPVDSGEFKARVSQGFLGLCELLFPHEDVVGVKSGNRKDADTGFSKRSGNRSKYAGKPEIQYPIYSNDVPVAFRFHIQRDLILLADDGEFGFGMSNAMKVFAIHPVGGRRVRFESANCKAG